MHDLPKKILFFANTEWYLFNFRLAFAKHLRLQGVEVIMVSPLGPYGKKLEEQGFRWIPIPMVRRSLNPFTEAWLIWQLSRIYRTEKPDIVHHFTIKCVVYGGLAASLAGIQRVVSAVTGLGYVFIGNDLKTKILRPIVRQLMRFAMNGPHRHLILQNNDDRKTFLSADLVRDEHIHVIAGSGVDIQRFQPKLLTPNDDLKRPCKIVFAARLLWDKGLAELIQAARILGNEAINAQFLIAGDPDPGNPASITSEVLSEWKKVTNVVFLGHVSNMAQLLAEADVMVLPSYREGLPRSLIEAAAAALPIVTTDAPGCRDVVDNGVSGFIVPVRDSIALASALRILANDPSLGIQMGIAGRIKVLAEFDERLVFKKTLEVYRELLKN